MADFGDTGWLFMRSAKTGLNSVCSRNYTVKAHFDCCRSIIGLTAMVALLTSCGLFTPKQEPPPQDIQPVSVPASKPIPKRVTRESPALKVVPIEIREDAPLKYVVKKGDTLWDISNYFLKDPWLWPELWYTNPDIKNPHLIYPGDVLYLVWVDGKPQLRRDIDGLSITGEKLLPQVRELTFDAAIKTIPLDALAAFLKGPRVVGLEELTAAPYIVEFAGDHLIGSAGIRAYAKGVTRDYGVNLTLVRQGQRYEDPNSDEILGYEAIYVADANVEIFDVTSTLFLRNTTRETLIGDRLLSADDYLPQANFFPHAPDAPVEGSIISVYDGVSQIGQYQIVTINKGAREGIEPGHVFKVFKSGRFVRDPYSKSRKKTIELPEEEAGVMMVFKTYSRISYGLIMTATRVIHVGDKVANPRNF